MTDEQPKVDGASPPICPSCHHPVFRAGRMATFLDMMATADQGGAYTVCMWCSAIWKLSGPVEALSFKHVDPADAVPLLRDAARRFATHRAVAKAIGVPYERFSEELGPLAAAVRQRFGKPPQEPRN